MSNICTNIDQSKELIKLGIDVNTANMYWWYSGKRFYIEAMDDGDFSKEGGDIPAWSLSALLKLINSDYKLEKSMLDQSFIFTYAIHIEGVYRTREYDEPLDAAFEMISYLLKSNKNEII